MHTISARHARTAAQALYLATIIAIADSGCIDPAPDDGPQDPSMTSPLVPGPGAPGSPSLDASPGVVAAEAGAPSADAAIANPVALHDRVDANGVRGALVDIPYLADVEGRKNLMQVDWEIPAGKEVYLCGRVTVPDDLYFNEFYPVSPAGTHHTAMSIAERPSGPDGVTLCDATEIARRSIGGSGVGTLSRTMPEGIAMKAERGSQLLLNLHLFNTTDAPLRGRSGSLVVTVAASQVKEIADGVSAGPIMLDIPPGHSVQTGACTVDYDYTIFSIFPHMHEMGRHMKVVAKRVVGDPVVLWDAPYDFTHQLAYRLETPLALAIGDRIEVTCTYDNTTGQVLHFGESSKDEMCLAGLARFPAGGRTACPK